MMKEIDELSIELYEELMKISTDIDEFTKKAKTYPTQFSLNKLNKECYNKIYLEQSKAKPRQDLFSSIPLLKEECASCWKFYLSSRNKSIRILDLQLGKKFELKLIKFLKSKGINCQKGDDKNKMYPDNLVIKNEKPLAYLEVKYQSAPWIFAFKEENTKRECYEASPALDIKKLKQQIDLVDSGEINVPIYYVYWLDFPCIKGIFYISLNDMKKYFQNDAKQFDRKEREGDFIESKGVKKKVSATSKIHPSLFMMESFKKLLEVLR